MRRAAEILAAHVDGSGMTREQLVERQRQLRADFEARRLDTRTQPTE
jgi:hypothetical protein